MKIHNTLQEALNFLKAHRLYKESGYEPIVIWQLEDGLMNVIGYGVSMFFEPGKIAAQWFFDENSNAISAIPIKVFTREQLQEDAFKNENSDT